MSRGLFDKWRAALGSTRDERGLSALPAAAPPTDAVTSFDTASTAPVDESLLVVSRELSALSTLPVSAAAKERGWAALQRELERHPVRAAGKGVRDSKGLGVPAIKAAAAAGATRGRSRGLRWALVSAAAAVAVVAALLGTYGGGLLQTADNGGSPSTVASVVNSTTTAPTGVPTSVSPMTTQGPGDGPVTTDGGQSGVTTVPDTGTTIGPAVNDGTVTTGGTQPTTPVTTRPSTPVTTPGGTAGTSTTQPRQTTTTGEQQMAAAQREGSAKALAVYLADMVITGNTSGARSLVASEAQASLAQMVLSLQDPYGYKITGAQSLTSDTVRVTLEISDRVANNVGETVETAKRFAIRVRLDGESAVVTAINRGS